MRVPLTCGAGKEGIKTRRKPLGLAASGNQKKRANGEGNIRKRKDGRWEGRYTAGYDQDGKRIIKNVLGRTQAEVKSKLSVAIAES